MAVVSSSSESGSQKVRRALYQTLIEFPWNALTTSRQQDHKTRAIARENVPAQSGYRLDPNLCQLCQSSETVSSLLAQDPSIAPGHAWKYLFKHHSKLGEKFQDIRDIGAGFVDGTELSKALNCGIWGPDTPSDLFLRMYHDALCTLNESPELGMVSPPLLGSNGVVPLTIISVIPDIVRHMSNLIVRAEKEVFLATNFWQNGIASKYITNAIKELSRRAGDRGVKIVMKIIYDRGSPKQLFEPHYIVPEREYTGKAVGLPAPDEIPNIDLEVMNFHNPLLGTFHAKYMVVDRKIAILQSNNIQDNDNLEMMVQFEGPIVDSIYEVALLSWHKKLDPPLPSYDSPAVASGITCFDSNHEGIDPKKLTNGENGYGRRASRRARSYPKLPKIDGTLLPLENKCPATPSEDRPETRQSLVSEQKDSSDPDTEQSPQSQKETPENKIVDLSPISPRLPEHTYDDAHYDDDIAGEVTRVQAAISPKPWETQMDAVMRHLNHTTNKEFKGDAPECDSVMDQMTPYIPHQPHEPVPIAMVCRPPFGPPNHKSVSNPQNAVWLSALRNATKNVFIQSPTLNAEPLVPAIIEACERGVDVFCYICLGYNDSGELLPMQGGHNEMVSNHLHKSLSDAARQHLHFFWYVAKDQTKPIISEKKRRSCHIKLMIVDEHIGIMGSGNQDTQSWFHSQEINVMLDSHEICRAWLDGLRRNQNTHLYGAVDMADGVWRDADGKQADGAIGADPGMFSWARGVIGAVKRLQGTGGF